MCRYAVGRNSKAKGRSGRLVKITGNLTSNPLMPRCRVARLGREGWRQTNWEPGSKAKTRCERAKDWSSAAQGQERDLKALSAEIAVSPHQSYSTCGAWLHPPSNFGFQPVATWASRQPQQASAYCTEGLTVALTSSWPRLTIQESLRGDHASPAKAFYRTVYGMNKSTTPFPDQPLGCTSSRLLATPIPSLLGSNHVSHHPRNVPEGGDFLRHGHEFPICFPIMRQGHFLVETIPLGVFHPPSALRFLSHALTNVTSVELLAGVDPDRPPTFPKHLPSCLPGMLPRAIG